jgi:ABC-type transport system involved in cytochrome bd biosynthesis fused ATPase/permease subunit
MKTLLIAALLLTTALNAQAAINELCFVYPANAKNMTDSQLLDWKHKQDAFIKDGFDKVCSQAEYTNAELYQMAGIENPETKVLTEKELKAKKAQAREERIGYLINGFWIVLGLLGILLSKTGFWISVGVIYFFYLFVKRDVEQREAQQRQWDKELQLIRDRERY